jgi:hypothetical protein
MKRPSNLRAARDIAPADGAAFDLKRRKSVPHEFVLEAISSVSPWTRPMFGCLAVYVDEKIVLVLRDKQDYLSDNGVWLATTVEHHKSLRREFPAMRSIGVLGKGVTGWQVLPTDAGISKNWRCAPANSWCAGTLESAKCPERDAPSRAAQIRLRNPRNLPRKPGDPQSPNRENEWWLPHFHFPAWAQPLERSFHPSYAAGTE